MEVAKVLALALALAVGVRDVLREVAGEGWGRGWWRWYSKGDVIIIFDDGAVVAVAVAVVAVSSGGPMSLIHSFSPSSPGTMNGCPTLGIGISMESSLDWEESGSGGGGNEEGSSASGAANKLPSVAVVVFLDHCSTSLRSSLRRRLLLLRYPFNNANKAKARRADPNTPPTTPPTIAPVLFVVVVVVFVLDASYGNGNGACDRGGCIGGGTGGGTYALGEEGEEVNGAGH